MCRDHAIRGKPFCLQRIRRQTMVTIFCSGGSSNCDGCWCRFLGVCLLRTSACFYMTSVRPLWSLIYEGESMDLFAVLVPTNRLRLHIQNTEETSWWTVFRFCGSSKAVFSLSNFVIHVQVYWIYLAAPEYLFTTSFRADSSISLSTQYAVGRLFHLGAASAVRGTDVFEDDFVPKSTSREICRRVWCSRPMMFMCSHISARSSCAKEDFSPVKGAVSTL